MTLPWREHPEATEELLAAILYYHGWQAGLGDEFAAEVVRSIEDVQWNPGAWPKPAGWNRLPVVRSRKVNVFPYRIVYFVRDDEIVIVAYAAIARWPGYWKHRIGD